MIFYFTGTGNSGYAASETAKGTNDEIISISKLMRSGDKLEFTLKEGENIGFVFPIYAWAPPKMVLDFIKKAKFINYKDNYVFAIATCGADIGNTMKLVKKALAGKSMNLNSGFSIAMPNNYIIMGNVDSKEEEKQKLDHSKVFIEKIVKIINNKENNVFKIKKGTLGALLTTVVNPMFVKHAMDPGKFYANDKCVGCGLCANVCNTGTIMIVDQKPVWGKDCTQCLACLHSCPKQAIQYGKGTEAKGRYVNPYFKLV